MCEVQQKRTTLQDWEVWLTLQMRNLELLGKISIIADECTRLSKVTDLRKMPQARHEALPELSDMLAQNLLKDEQDRWYVPDPARQEDLEKLRERSLLREFQEYALGKGRLRVFRTEAVRAGFKRAWAERDYQLIIKVAQRLPASVLQEDPGLLMYYDNALMRAESEPVQGRLL